MSADDQLVAVFCNVVGELLVWIQRMSVVAIWNFFENSVGSDFGGWDPTNDPGNNF